MRQPACATGPYQTMAEKSEFSPFIRLFRLQMAGDLTQMSIPLSRGFEFNAARIQLTVDEIIKKVSK